MDLHGSTVYNDLKSEIWKRATLATLATLGFDFHWTVADRCISPKTLLAVSRETCVA